MVPYLRAANVKDGALDLTDVKSMNFTPAEQQIFSLRFGDVLVTEGSGSLQAVGASAVWRGEVDAIVCFQNTLLRMRPRSGITDGRFLEWWARSAFGSGLFASVATGANIYHISAERVRALPIELPALEEQRRIADFLDAETARIDKLAELRERQTTLLEERLKAVWARVINDDARNSTWSPIRRFITAITDGPFGSALTSHHYSNHGARVIRLGNVGRAEFRDHDSAYIPLEYFSGLRRHEALPGDLLIAGLGDQNHPLGRACVVPDDLGPAMVKADCFRLRLDQRRVLHEYAAWALSSPPVTDQVTLLARGATRARINLEVAREIPLPAPPVERQRSSIARLREVRFAINSVVSRCRRQVALLSERRQALITAAVTGQFDVSTASGRNVTEGVSA
jgi:type I restriction enzyme S subunit